MALQTYRVQAALGMYNDPDQHATNTWYIRGISAGPSQGDDINALEVALNTFYQAIDATLSAATFDGRFEYTVYNMADPEPRVPISEDPGATLTFGGGNPLPSDVSLCMSYSADIVSGDVRARKRGRMFFGPLASSVGTSVTDEGLRVSSATRTAYVNAAVALATALGASDLQWRMYSPTNQDFPLLQLVWVDDSFDTRRSRDKPGFTRTESGLAQ